jgi:hypothetical protein
MNTDEYDEEKEDDAGLMAITFLFVLLLACVVITSILEALTGKK